MFHPSDVDVPEQWIAGEKDTPLYEYPEVMLAYNIFVVVAAVLIPIAVVTNILIFSGIVLYPAFHNPTNVLMFSIACYDLIIGVIVLPAYILCYASKATNGFIGGNKYLCLFKLSTPMISADGSLYSLMLLSIDRYLAVLFPLRYTNWVTIRRAVFVTIGVGVFVCVRAYVPMMGWNRYNDTLPDVTARCGFYKTLYPLYITWFMDAPNYLAVCVSIVVNLQVGFILMRQLRSFKTQSTGWTSEQRRSFEYRVSTVKMTMVLMVLFIVLTFPYLLVPPFVWYSVFPKDTTEVFKTCATILTFSNAVVKAPVYALIRSEYWSVYRTLLTNAPCKWRKCLQELHREKTPSSAPTPQAEKVPEVKKQNIAEEENMRSHSIFEWADAASEESSMNPPSFLYDDDFLVGKFSSPVDVKPKWKPLEKMKRAVSRGSKDFRGSVGSKGHSV